MNRLHILVLTLAAIQLTSGAVQRETCLSKIQKLQPQKNIDLNKIYGEWMGVKIGYKNATLVPKTATVTCFSQVISKQATPKSLGIKTIFTRISDNKHIERVGQVTFPTNEIGKWRWSFQDNLAQFWQGVILETGYTSYWIHYECEEAKEGYLIETIVLRHKQRNPPAAQLATIQNKMVKYGFPAKNIISIQQKC